MARRRRKYTNKPKRKSSAPRAKPIRLDPEVWLRSPKSIADYRESLLVEQEYKCAISNLPLTLNNSTLDHAHIKSSRDVGKCRGVLQSEVNMLEGRFLKLFQKAKLDYKYNLDFAEVLISMGEYLQRDNSHQPLHFKLMEEVRNRIKRLNREEIVDKLLKEFNIKESTTTEKGELVRVYVQAFVDLVEIKEKEE